MNYNISCEKCKRPILDIDINKKKNECYCYGCDHRFKIPRLAFRQRGELMIPDGANYLRHRTFENSLEISFKWAQNLDFDLTKHLDEFPDKLPNVSKILAYLINKTTIVADKKSIKIEHKPIDVLPSVYYNAKLIKQLFVRKIKIKTNLIPIIAKSDNQYGLFTQFKNGKEELWFWGLKKNTLLFIEQELERLWGLEDLKMDDDVIEEDIIIDGAVFGIEETFEKEELLQKEEVVEDTPLISDKIKAKNINDKINAIRKSTKELIAIEVYLKGLNEQQPQLQTKIEQLEKQLKALTKRYNFFDSGLIKLFLGKYSKGRINRTEKIKKSYLKTAKALENFELTRESLEYQKEVLREKINKKNDEIDQLIEQIDFDNSELIEDEFKGKETIQEYENLVDYKEFQIKELKSLNLLLDKIIPTLDRAIDDLDANLPDPGLSVEISIYNLIEGMEQKFLEITEAKDLFVKQSKAFCKVDEFVNDNLIRQIKDIGKIDLIELVVIESKRLNQVLWVLGEYLELIKNARNNLSTEIELTQKDVINFRDAQKTFIKNWERGNTESLFDRIHVIRSTGEAINMDERTP